MVVDWNTLQKALLVSLLASVLIIGLAPYALADDDDDNRGRGDDDEKDERKGSDDSEKKEKSGNDDKRKADEPNEEKNDPQQSPPPQQSPQTPVENPVSNPAQNPERIPIVEQRAVSDSLALGDTSAKTSANSFRPVHDSIAAGESIASQSAIRLTRDISESLALADLNKMTADLGPSGVSVDSELRLLDHIATSGLVVTPTAPVISVISPPVLHVLDNQDADIMFHSTVAGTYSVEIRGPEGAPVNTLEGDMVLGTNSVSWDGRQSGSMVPAGNYEYYITAKGSGGVRSPPADGDGSIVVTGLGQTATFPSLQDIVLMVAIPVAAVATMVSLLLLRRKKSLTFYLPLEAVEVVDDIRGKYPDAKLEDYIQPAEEGMQRYTGVTIQNPKDVDDGWLASIAEKVKDVSGVESVNVSFRGKTHFL